MPPLLQAATTKFSLGAAISNNNIQDKTQHDGGTGSDLSVSPTRLELRPFFFEIEYRQLSRFDCRELAWPRCKNILVAGRSTDTSNMGELF